MVVYEAQFAKNHLSLAANSLRRLKTETYFYFPIFAVLYSLSRNKIKGVSDRTIGIVMLSSAFFMLKIRGAVTHSLRLKPEIFLVTGEILISQQSSFPDSVGRHSTGLGLRMCSELLAGSGSELVIKAALIILWRLALYLQHPEKDFRDSGIPFSMPYATFYSN